MHPVLMLTRNNLHLTKRAVESVYKQRLRSIYLWIIDNGSTDGTSEWASNLGCNYEGMGYNTGVSAAWNRGLKWVFNDFCADRCLVLNNDIALPEWFYAELLSYEVPFVTGIAVDSETVINRAPPRMPLTPNPDFSAFLISRYAWETIGPFNERMMLYSSDQDYHVRGHRLGVGMFKANVPYLHQRSSTLNNAGPQEQAVIRAQAEVDRGQFRAIYGCNAPSPEYDALFK